MSSAPTELPVMSFYAGTLPVAVAAGGVNVLSAADREHAHLAELLDLKTDTPSGNERSVQLSHGDRSVFLRVDGPVRIEDITASQIIVTPASMRPVGKMPIMAYAERLGQLVALLDISKLVEMVRQGHGDEQSERA